jgi:hypothetical protein
METRIAQSFGLVVLVLGIGVAVALIALPGQSKEEKQFIGRPIEEYIKSDPKGTQDGWYAIVFNSPEEETKVTSWLKENRREAEVRAMMSYNANRQGSMERPKYEIPLPSLIQVKGGVITDVQLGFDHLVWRNLLPASQN